MTSIEILEILKEELMISFYLNEGGMNKRKEGNMTPRLFEVAIGVTRKCSFRPMKFQIATGYPGRDVVGSSTEESGVQQSSLG